MPFAALPGYIDKVKRGVKLERPTAQLIEEREALVADYRELLDTDEDRATYDQLIGLAHRVFPYVEGHKFYCEHWYTNLFFNKIREFGDLLWRNGFFPEPADVFHLTHYELESAIIDLMLSWSSGSAPIGPRHWPAKVKGAQGGDPGLVRAQCAAGAGRGAGRDRRSGHRHALGHYPRASTRGCRSTRTSRATN